MHFTSLDSAVVEIGQLESGRGLRATLINGEGRKEETKSGRNERDMPLQRFTSYESLGLSALSPGGGLHEPRAIMLYYESPP